MHVYDLHDPQSKEKLSDLSNQGAAECVRILHLRPYMLGPPNRPSPEKRPWPRLKRRISGSGWRTKGSTKREVRSLLGNLKKLRNLEHLDVQCLPNDDIDSFKQTIPSLRNSWSSYESSLRILSLKIPLECYQLLLPPALFLPRLNELTFHIFASHHSTNPVEPMCSALVPFVNRHVSTLESLSVVTPETGTADLSPMFFSLKFFPRLAEIRLVFCALSLEYINLKGIQEFFAAHSTQLQHTVLHFNRMVGLKAEDFRAGIFFALPVFRVPLHSLQSLDLGFTGFRDATAQGTISYANKFRNSLQHLRLNHTQLSIGNVARLVSQLSLLRSLEIFVYHISPTLLDLMSTKLLQLVDLRLTCISFSGSGGPFNSVDDPARAHKFCAEMSRRLYVGWSLRHLRTQALANKAGNLNLCQRALATALPDIETIDGSPRVSYLNEEKSRFWNLSVYEN